MYAKATGVTNKGFTDEKKNGSITIVFYLVDNKVKSFNSRRVEWRYI